MTDNKELSKVDHNRKGLVTKSNKMIEASYGALSFAQVKILNFAISQLTNETPIGHWFEYNAADMLGALNMGSQNYSNLRRATLGLTKGIEIIKDDALYQVPLLITKYVPKEGKVCFRFDQDAHEHFLNLTREFTSYYFENVMRLNSIGAISLYELSRQYRKIGFRRLSIEDIRFFLGIKEGTHKLYGNLKRDVLDKYVEDINNHTDLRIEISGHKTGRKYTHIDIYIKEVLKFDGPKIKELGVGRKELEAGKKEAPESQFEQIDMIGGFSEHEQEIFDYLISNYNFSKEEAKDYIQKIDLNAIVDASYIVLDKFEKGEIEQTPAQYMRGVLNKMIEVNEFWNKRPPKKRQYWNKNEESKENNEDKDKIIDIAKNQLLYINHVSKIKDNLYREAIKWKNSKLLESLEEFKKSPPYFVAAKNLSNNDLSLITEDPASYFSLASKHSAYTSSLKVIKANYIQKEIDAGNINIPSIEEFNK